MLKILMFVAFVALMGLVIMWAASFFSSERRAARTNSKADRLALTAARQRSNLAERALREIAAGAEYPVFVAEDALRNINDTYHKEIQ